MTVEQEQQKKKKTSENTRTEDFREQEEDAVNEEADAKPSKKARGKSSRRREGLVPTPIGQDLNVEVTSRGIDDTEMKRVVEKFKLEKKNATPITAPIDEKSKLLMDRLPTKKPCPVQKDNGMDEASSFYTKPKEAKKKSEVSVFLNMDDYDQFPKLADVLMMSPYNVFNADGVPFWAVNPEPNDEDLKTTAPIISVGSEHLELYHDKKITLQTIENTQLMLNELQPLTELMKRDEIHFTPQLVFSNTLRSIVNPQQMEEKQRSGSISDESQKPGKLVFDIEKVEEYVYSRSNPIESAKMLLQERKLSNVQTTTTSTAAATSNSCDEPL